MLSAVEKHYNNARSLELDFLQSHTAYGRKRLENGHLVLRKPGRMRWVYSQPEGKLFVSDGRWFYFYSPQTGRAEKAALKESDDFRAPLAFLLGKLEFRRHFRDIELRDDNGESVLRALPKSDRVPYKQVQFIVTPANQIRGLTVQGFDGTVQEFQFTNERLNVSADDSLFRFVPPAGVEVLLVESFGEAEER